MKFKIRDLTFYIRETKDSKKLKYYNDEYEVLVKFVDGNVLNITEELGVGPSETESGCCYQSMVWMEKTGI